MQGGVRQGRRGATPMQVTAANNSKQQEPAASSQQPIACCQQTKNVFL